MTAEGTGSHMPLLVPTTSPPPRRISRVLEELACKAEASITVEQIRQALGDRSFAAFLVLFSCLNLLPLPPGSTLIFGVPLLLIAVQMVLGRRTVWLPRFLLQKSINADQFRRMSDRFTPRIRWLERYIRPRYWPFTRERADRVIGVFVLILAVAITLPIPFGNWFPALACALTGLAVSERDGILFAVAMGTAVFAFILIAAVIGAAGALTNLLIG